MAAKIEKPLENRDAGWPGGQKDRSVKFIAKIRSGQLESNGSSFGVNGVMPRGNKPE